MIKNLNIKISKYSKENWENFIENDFLPILIIKNPKIYKKTPIHFPLLSGSGMTPEEYKKHLDNNVDGLKFLNSLEVLSHVSCAHGGLVIITEEPEDTWVEILKTFLGNYLIHPITEYEYNRN